MSQPQITMSRVRPGLFIAIILTLLAIFLATYSGNIESSDSLRVIDAASSLVNFGDTLRDESLWQEAPREFLLEEQFPFSKYAPDEPLIAYISAIPYALARHLPVGQVHAVWILNIVILAISGGLLYILACLLNFDSRTAILAAFIFGIATIVWAYSKTLFRDPAVILFFLVIAIALELWRHNRWRLWWPVIAVASFFAAFLMKNSAIIALPAFIIWNLPDVTLPKMAKRALDSALLAGLVILIMALNLQPIFDILTMPVQQFRSFNPVIARQAIHTFLLSIGGSFWGTSPVLLLGFAGAVIMVKDNQRRIVWATVTLVVAYAVVHGIFGGVFWFGGLSLPPRFLVPVIPFAVILILPVIQMALETDKLWLRLLVVSLAGFSIIVQFIFSVSVLNSYVSLLPPEANGLVEWLPGLNQPQYLRWILLPQSWSSIGWDVIWGRIDAGWVVIAYLTIAVLACASFFASHLRKFVLPVLVIGLVGLTAYGFNLLYQRDTRYWAQTPELFEMLEILEANGERDELLFLASSADVTYARFILNYNTQNAVRPVITGFQPGERASSADDTALESDFNGDRLDVTMLRYMDHLVAFEDRFWWLAHNSVFTSWAVRPEERHFAQNYYLLNDYQTANPTVRLLEFSSIDAPDRQAFRLPDYLSNFRFGDSIRLEGYSLPSGTQYAQGDVVPITLYWQTSELLDTSYTVSWFLVNAGEPYNILQGFDSEPDAGFAPTTSWQPGQFVYDNRAIQLPDDVPEGTYRMWVRLYVTGSGGEDQLAVTGGDTQDGTIAILPIQIEVVRSS